jgi:uncharacterized RDD family membrane protein YckC
MAGARSDGERSSPLDTTTDIETPEHVRFQVRIAGPSRRALAYGIDFLVRMVVLIVLVLVASVAGASIDFAEASQGVILVVAFVLEWGYYIVFESLWSGQSPGKKLMGLRTVKEGGYPVTFIDVVLRNLLRGADWLPAFNVVGLAVMAFDSRFRRLGDLVAGTMVVSEERSRIGSALRISPPPSAEELEWIPASVRLDGAELDALELFLRRVGALSSARESELAEIVAPVFARRLGLRYRDPGRFLAVLYVRAGGGHAVPIPAAQTQTRGLRKRRRA